MAKKASKAPAHREPPTKIAIGNGQHFNLRFDTAELDGLKDDMQQLYGQHLADGNERISLKEFYGHLLKLGAACYKKGKPKKGKKAAKTSKRKKRVDTDAAAAV